MSLAGPADSAMPVMMVTTVKTVTNAVEAVAIKANATMVCLAMVLVNVQILILLEIAVMSVAPIVAESGAKPAKNAESMDRSMMECWAAVNASVMMAMPGSTVMSVMLTTSRIKASVWNVLLVVLLVCAM